MPDKTYEQLRREVRALQDEGKLPTQVTREQAADWAFGNTVIENEDVTLEMAERAAEEKIGNR